MNAFTTKASPGSSQNLIATSLALFVRNFWHPKGPLPNPILKKEHSFYNKMGPGYADRFIQAGLKTGSANILSGSEEIAHVDLAEVDSPYKFVLMIPQSETERLLEEHLATFGVKAERQNELKSFQETVDGVSCALQHADGTEETVEAYWLIGCDGAHSVVRHQLGMEFQGSTLLSDWVLADLHLSGISGPSAINIYWHAEGVLALFPLAGTRYRIIADVGESAGSIGEGNRPAPSIEDVQRILDVRGPGGIQASNPVWLSSFSINERKVQDYRSGRPGLSRRRRSPHPQPRRWPGHEHGNAGRLQSRMEAGPRLARSLPA
jgi:2-polyprenyl-6-methoxyphenol hydroxylase-like FAD-dependent oxidoreductase